jgi:hypothetical protein
MTWPDYKRKIMKVMMILDEEEKLIRREHAKRSNLLISDRWVPSLVCLPSFSSLLLYSHSSRPHKSRARHWFLSCRQTRGQFLILDGRSNANPRTNLIHTFSMNHQNSEFIRLLYRGIEGNPVTKHIHI